MWRPRGRGAALPWILGLALVVRLATIVASPDYTPLFDSGDYERHALSIAHGHGYPESVFAADGGPTAFRPPLYPYVLGALYAVSGDGGGELAGRVAGALLGVLVVWLLYRVCIRVWGERVAIVAAALAAVAPPLVYLNAALITEPLFLSLILTVVLAVLAARRGGGDWRWAAAAGALCGLAALTRSNGILLLIPAVVGVWVARPAFGRAAFAAPIAVLLAAAVTVLPWTVRNAIEFDRLVPISTQSGFGMAGQFNDEARDYPGHPASWVLPQQTARYGELYRRPGLDEAELDREVRARALDYARDDPAYVIEATVRNTLRTFDLMSTAEVARLADERQLGLEDATAELVKWSTYALDLLALAGVVALLARPREARGPWFIWLIPVLLVASAVWLIASTRYRAPAYPFMIMLAAIAIVDLGERLRSRRRPVGEPGTAG